MDINAHIKSVTYQTRLHTPLPGIPLSALSQDLKMPSSFLLELDPQNKWAFSWWISPKRTRSYPYARVYDTLSFSGRKVTIIPVYKDEGLNGDRDFIQWDTISLMSLLGVNVIIGYYSNAIRNPKYQNKITNQIFDFQHIRRQIELLRNYQSDALHWNLEQAEQISEIGQTALAAYYAISERTGVQMHSDYTLGKMLRKITQSAQVFKNYSREQSRRAQARESITTQPKELVNILDKSKITITNYLGGEYNFTTDEAWLENGTIYIAECKHSAENKLPSLLDIKDGCIKMVLYTNFDNVSINGKEFPFRPLLRLTSGIERNADFHTQPEVINVIAEATTNNFEVRFS